MLAVLIVASMNVFSGLSGSIAPPAVTSLKWPRTVIIPRCLAENSTCVCIGSNFQTAIDTSCLTDWWLLMAKPTDWRLHLFQSSLSWCPHGYTRRRGRSAGPWSPLRVGRGGAVGAGCCFVCRLGAAGQRGRGGCRALAGFRVDAGPAGSKGPGLPEGARRPPEVQPVDCGRPHRPPGGGGPSDPACQSR